MHLNACKNTRLIMTGVQAIKYVVGKAGVDLRSIKRVMLRVYQVGECPSVTFIYEVSYGALCTRCGSRSCL